MGGKTLSTQQQSAPVTAPSTSVGPSVVQERGNSAEQSALGTSSATSSGQDGVRSDISNFTPEYVEAHRNELGIPAGASIRDFFHEFVAKDMTAGVRSELTPDALYNANKGPDDQSAEYYQAVKQDELMRSWGYSATPGAEVNNKDDGFYAVRYDPLEGQEHLGSIVSSRGTEPFTPDESNVRNPWGFANDLISDTAADVGRDQFNNNKDAMTDLINGGTDRSNFTGYSLGGYHAQRWAADNFDKVQSLSTFQSGGIEADKANRFNDLNAEATAQGDGRDVSHHVTNRDFVHWAGDVKLDGQHHMHQTDALTFGHLKKLMWGTEDELLPGSQMGDDKVSQDHAFVNQNFRQGVEGLRTGAGGAIRAGMSPINAAYQTGVTLGETGKEAWNDVSTGFSDAGNEWDNGNYLSAVGEGAGGLLDATGTAVVGTGKAAWDGVSTLATDAVSGAGQVLDGAGHIVKGVGGAAWDGAKAVGSWLNPFD